MNWKRNSSGVVLFLFWLALTVFIAGCQKQTKPGVTTIRWVADPNPIRKEQIRIFEKDNTGVKVNLDWASKAGAGMEKVLTQMAGGAAPDTFIVYSRADFITFIKKGVLEDLTPYCEKYNVNLEDFWPALKPWIYYEGKVYGFPEVIDIIVLFYNKKLLDDAGIPYPTEKWTWDNLMHAAERLTLKDAAEKHSRYGLAAPSVHVTLVPTIIKQYGGRMYGPDGKRCIIDSDEAVEALSLIHRMLQNKIMPTNYEMQNLGTSGLVGPVDLFATGKIAFYLGGRPSTIALRNYKDLDWAVAPIPKAKYKITMTGSHTNVLAKNARHKEEAFRFIKSLVSEESQLLIADFGEAIPTKMSFDKSRFLFNPAHPNETYNHVYLDEMSYGQDMEEISPYASPIEVGRIWEEEILDKFFIGLQGPEDALHNVARRVNELISKNVRESGGEGHVHE